MRKSIALFFVSMYCIGMSAQGSDLYGSGMKIKLNDDGSKYVRVISWAQVWSRYNVNNTGSTRNGDEVSGTFDVGLRRARMLFLSQLSNRFLILAHFGINNQNSLSSSTNTNPNIANPWKPGIFFHDIWTEFKVSKGNELSIGAGLHYWNGISRSTNASTLNFLTLDAPIVNWATIDAADEFARMMGIYAKGKLNKLDYRIAVNTPFAKQAATVASGGLPAGQFGSKFNPKNNNVNLQGYFNWQFLDQESNLLPFMVGSYLGSKKVFNVGVGFEKGFDAILEKTSATDSSVKDMMLFSVDAFLDMPVSSKKDAITAYVAYYNYDFGKNFYRNIGIMNVTDGLSSAATSSSKVTGNGFPTIGTGQAFHAQFGYLLPKSKSTVRIQPYGNITMQNWEGVKNADGSSKGWFANGNLGCNWLLEGHHAKITTDIGLRPDFNTTNATVRPCFTVQTMVYL